MVGAIIFAAWLALLVGFVGGSAWVAYRQEGVTLIGRRFVAEVATLMVGMCVVLYVVPFVARVAGIAP